MMYSYNKDGVSFQSTAAAGLRTIYMPLCGTDGTKIKSSITPTLSGDIKIDKMQYVTKPCSTEDLRQPLRQVFVDVDGKSIVSLSAPDNADQEMMVEIGQLWQRVTRTDALTGCRMSALNFVPVTGENVELMQVTITNTSTDAIEVTPTIAVPLFARALANKHDHEQVTSLLHRSKQVKQGVMVTPCMSFNEEGHLPNEATYFVLAKDEEGRDPVGTFPTFESFYGDGGDAHYPQAVYERRVPAMLSEAALQGKEVVGALRFDTVTLPAGASRTYVVQIGVATHADDVAAVQQALGTPSQVASALDEVKKFWHAKSSSIVVKTGDAAFDAWMRWVTIQPVLRRIYGCSFLPDHDYGKGGKGWRDIWQDLLSLILIEPNEVRQTLIDNCAGVRIDGSNATIIGARPGEFIADRNAITRVWMDHGVWPLKTILLYIDQTGDVDILFEQVPYFRDVQWSRTTQKDPNGTPQDNVLKTASGEVYQGTVLEHLLVQHLVPFFNVGEHNMMRLESADWNDGLDMAFERGESVAFTAAYAGNLKELAVLLDDLSTRKGLETVTLAEELLVLLGSLGSEPEMDGPDAAPQEREGFESSDLGGASVAAKKKVLFEQYFPAVQPTVSGAQQAVAVKALVADLNRKAEELRDRLRQQEKVSAQGHTWFNGYYDNKGERVEGVKNDRVWMTLTGQVFPVMSGVATTEDTAAVIKAVDAFLKDPALGGYRLNSNFGREPYLDLGRAFGFAFGTKENGAFFSHMIVMYAYALYSQGFGAAGHAVLDSIYQMCMDTDRSKIYPGIPEYCDSTGRGMYHYLTGSASWLVLAELTQVFGVRGQWGDLCLDPQLVPTQFDDDGRASVTCQFAGQLLTVVYVNAARKPVDVYHVSAVTLDGQAVPTRPAVSRGVLIDRAVVAESKKPITLEVTLN